MDGMCMHIGDEWAQGRGKTKIGKRVMQNSRNDPPQKTSRHHRSTAATSHRNQRETRGYS